jgi:spore maturation protein CgeB
MKNEDLQSFITAFDDFMKHFDAEELYYEGRKVYENHRAEARRIQAQEIEKLASKYEVTCDYYMMEFM